MRARFSSDHRMESYPRGTSLYPNAISHGILRGLVGDSCIKGTEVDGLAECCLCATPASAERVLDLVVPVGHALDDGAVAASNEDAANCCRVWQDEEDYGIVVGGTCQ